jgi:hypothetical protein
MIGSIRRKCSSPAKSNSRFDLYERLATKAILMRELLEGSLDLLSEGQMSAAAFSAWRAIGVVLTTLLGFAFFNALIGVFGLSAAVIALLLFIALAVLIFRLPQTERARQ